MVWWNLVWFIASLVVGELLRPKLEVEDAAAAGADDANFPKAVVTDPIPVVFGRVRLRHPNIVWWGDYFADPIRKKVGKGGFMGTGHTIFATVAIGISSACKWPFAMGRCQPAQNLVGRNPRLVGRFHRRPHQHLSAQSVWRRGAGRGPGSLL